VVCVINYTKGAKESIPPESGHLVSKCQQTTGKPRHFSDRDAMLTSINLITFVSRCKRRFGRFHPEA